MSYDYSYINILNFFFFSLIVIFKSLINNKYWYGCDIIINMFLLCVGLYDSSIDVEKYLIGESMVGLRHTNIVIDIC